ncbi:MAG: hypothetical protein CMF60_02785 [Magnetococcales bacterium]|nr:hypothetical protein [Magnetococcales bacterium]|tara:strand:+ start:1102 stop:1437 length:336 start_codon:yes stop_codon:yes gene_type:complete
MTKNILDMTHDERVQLMRDDPKEFEKVCRESLDRHLESCDPKSKADYKAWQAETEAELSGYTGVKRLERFAFLFWKKYAEVFNNFHKKILDKDDKNSKVFKMPTKTDKPTS